MRDKDKGRLEVEDRGAVLIVRVDGGRHSLFGLDIAEQLEELVDRVDRDPSVHAVVFTGAHPERFVSHADVRWLQEGGAAVPSLGRRRASAVVRVARSADRARVLEPVVRRTPLRGAVELDRLHATFLRMNGSGVIFVAALNGSALGLGAEFAWACDLRVMADGDVFIGQPEVLLGIMPGGGGTQRLTCLIGTHRSLVAILEGKPFTPARLSPTGPSTRSSRGTRSSQGRPNSQNASARGQRGRSRRSRRPCTSAARCRSRKACTSSAQNS
jgi:enoyl-CoA hydratase